MQTAGMQLGGLPLRSLLIIPTSLTKIQQILSLASRRARAWRHLERDYGCQMDSRTDCPFAASYLYQHPHRCPRAHQADSCDSL